MDTTELESILYELLEGFEDPACDDDDGNPVGIEVSTFKDVGMLTNSAGLVLRMKDGSEYQITIVRRQ